MRWIAAVLLLVVLVGVVGAAPHQYQGYSVAESLSVNGRSVSVSDVAVYRTAYYARDGDSGWTPFELSGDVLPSHGDWLTGSASFDIPALQGEHYVIAYSCFLVGGGWDCHDGRWQLIVINPDALGDSLSLSAWVTVDSVSEDDVSKIVVKPTDVLAAPWEVYALDMLGNDVRFVLSDGSPDSWIGVTFPLSIGEEHFVVGTYDGSTMRLYVDGELVNFNHVSLTIGGSDRPLVVGRYPGCCDLDGIVGEHAEYDRVLSAEEVLELYGGDPPVGCSGASSQDCAVEHGVGERSRSCNNGVWSDWSSCALVSCDEGFVPSGNSCVASSCDGSSSQSCSIAHGVGERSRSCNNGVWSDWSGCSVVSCDNGYHVSGNACVEDDPVCTPDCGGKVCGPDGCGGACGPGCDIFTEACDGGLCVPAHEPTCDDGIRNQGETGVDCGGPCPACLGDTLNLGMEPYGYLTVGEIQSMLRDWVEAEPGMLSYEVYGETGGHDLVALRMSAVDVVDEQDVPKVLIQASIHGNEWIATAASLVAFHRLLSDYGRDDRVTALFSERVVYYVPVVNPVGFAARERNEEGRDPNRAFPNPKYPDTVPTSSVAAIMGFFEEKGFNAALDVHAYGRLVLTPWGYTRERFDEGGAGDATRAVARHMAEEVDYQWGTGQELLDYPSPGCSDDWFFIRGRELGFDTLALTLEIAEMQRPPISEISREADDVIESFIIFIEEAPVALVGIS